MADVFKRPGSPFWYATLTCPLKGRIRVSTGEKQQRAAKLWAHEKQEHLNRASQEGRDGLLPISLGVALGRYLEALEAARKPSTGHVRGLIEKSLGKMAGRFGLDQEMWLHDLTTEHLETLRVARQREGNSPQTIAHELKVLRASSHYAKRIRRRHAEKVDSWGLPKIVPKTRNLSWTEWSTVYERLAPGREFHSRSGNPFTFTDADTVERMQTVQDLFVALTMTGGRWSEVKALTWDRVDLDKLELTLWGTNKGRKRVVPMPPQFAEVLSRRYASTSKDQPLIFPGRDGGVRAKGTRTIAKAFADCGLNRADIVEREGTATIHSLRHTYASWLRQRGIQLDDVSDMLGHASLQMTRRYAAIRPEEQREGVRKALSSMGAHT